MKYDTSWAAVRQPWRTDGYFNVASPSKVDLSVTDFHGENAWWCAEFSRLSYQIENRLIRDALSKQRFQNVTELSAGRSFALSFEGRDLSDVPFTVVAFRGTDSLQDWVGNFKVMPMNWDNGGAVHAGFVEAYRLIESQLDMVLQPAEHVIITGHSLGGAMALLGASKYRSKTKFVYTFGAPKVGDEEFNWTLKGIPAFRMVNPNDIVPLVPPSTEKFDVQHYGEWYQVGASGEILMNGQGLLEENSELVDESRLSLLSPPKFASDHAPVNYVVGLNSMMKNRYG